MVEVIHHYHEQYPFGLKKQTKNTFMEVVKSNLNEPQLALYKQKAQIFRNINSPHLIKMLKMLKQQAKLHFIYEYQQTSLELYLDSVKTNTEGQLSRDHYRSIVGVFKQNIENIVDTLIKHEIKADLLLSCIAYAPTIQKDGNCFFKAFIDIEAEYLSLIEHAYRPKEIKKKDKSSINQDYLCEFYQAERKRLLINFQELLERKFGKIIQIEHKKQTPNFVINGTKLVFLNVEQPQKHKSDQRVVAKQQTNKYQQNKQKQIGTEEQAKRQLELKKITISKETTNFLKNKDNSEEKSEKKAIPKGPIVNFDQSFQPEFKPEQFTKENTYIYQETDYLESLEEQLNKLVVQKAMVDSKNTNNSSNDKVKQEQKHQKNKPQSHKPEQAKSLKTQENKQHKQKDLTISKNSNQSNYSQPNNQSYNSNMSSNNDSYQNKGSLKQKETKVNKVNKYKMKIITAHQIEIEGEGEDTNFEEMEKDILQGIRSGKINIQDLTSNNPNYQTISYPNNKQSNQSNDSKNEQKKDNTISSNKSIKKEQQSVQNKQRSNKKIGSQQQVQVKHHEQEKINKKKQIDDIIQKIKTRQNTNIQNAKIASQESKYEQKLQQKSSVNSSPTAIKNTETTPNKIQKMQAVEEKVEKAENYMNKIRQAKNKAQQILKEYTKKKTTIE